MAVGRIFKISKEQAGSYELVSAPKVRSRKRARRNPGVTAIMGISNPARPNKHVQFKTKTGELISFKTKTKKKPVRRGAQAKRAVPRRAPMRARKGRPAAAKALKPVRKTQTVGGIKCLAQPPAKYRRQGLTQRKFYALPQCFHYPVYTQSGKPDPKRIKRALSYYGRNKSRYSKAVRSQIEHGIATAARKAGLESPKAMEYRRKFGLANTGDETMIVMSKSNAARRRRKTRKTGKRLTPSKSFILFPASGAGVAGKAVANKRKAKPKRDSKGRFLKAGKAAPKRRVAARRAAPKRKAAARKSTAKHPRYGTKAYYKWLGQRAAAARKRKVAPKRRTVSATRVATRTGALRLHKVTKKAGRSRRFDYLDVTGAKRVSVSRGTTKKGRKSLRVAVRNINGKPNTWYKNKTKAVANLMRKYARANATMTDDPMTWQDEASGEYDVDFDAAGDPIRVKRGGKSGAASTGKYMTDDPMTWFETASDTEAAAAAAATGVAPSAFASQEDYEKWFAQMWTSSPKFKSYYMGHRRRISKGKRKMAKARGKGRRKAAKRKGSTKHPKYGTKAYYSWMGKRAAAKKRRKGKGKAASRPKRRVAARRAAPKRKTGGRRACGQHRVRTKSWYSCIGKKGGKAAARRRGKGRRRARRNDGNGFEAKANQAFAKVKALMVPGAMVLGGFVVHRFLTSIIGGTLGGMFSPQYAGIVSGLATAALGGVAATMLLKEKAVFPILGMIASFGTVLIRDLFPDVSNRLALGRIIPENTRTNWVLNGFGQPIMQAAAGFGQPIMQAAADYYTPQLTGMNEYVSNDLYPVSDFGEYVASNLDVQGYGDYEVQETYYPGADGFGAIDDGIRPDGNLDYAFRMMEAKAGVGQPIMQAAAGMGMSPMPMYDGLSGGPAYASTYVPNQQAGLIPSTQAPFDEGIFDIGGGNGILS